MLSNEYNIKENEIREDIITFFKTLYESGLLKDVKNKKSLGINLWPYSTTLEEAWLHLTNRCNLRCITCYKNAGEAYENELNTKEVKKLLKTNRKNANPKIIISGGEPLLRKDLVDILKYIKKLKFKYVSLITNGTLLNDFITSKISKLVDFVQVSLDGSNPLVNDKIRGKGVWIKVVKNLSFLKKYKVNFSLYPTINKYNYYDLENMLNVFPKLMGRNHFACAIMVKAGRGAYNSNKLALTPSELLNLWERIHRTKSFGKLLTGHEGFRMEITRMPGNLTQKLNCGAGSAVISIDANGDVYPCHLLMSKQFLAGNIKEQNF